MTPEQTQELAALKAALKQHIEEIERNYVDFSAHFRTMSPLACRIALEAIKALEEIVAEDKDQLMAADHDLIFILDLWKGGEA